jgi:hypothetical protein
VRGATSLAAACLILACSSPTSDDQAPIASSEPPAVAPQRNSKEQPVRVLVTGFNDWRELGEPANVWRCRDNPSCRLLLGDAHDHQPTTHAGPLVVRLREQAPELDWRFATMPVTWGVFAEVPDDVDVIINLGLGVYDRFDVLQLEAGAYNLRRGADAAGGEQPGPIGVGSDPVLEAPSAVAPRLAGLAGKSFAGYTVLVADAREDNSYLCNETHYYALSALARGHGRLREVYFLHIPYAKDGDYPALADGVAGLLLALLEPRSGW